VARFQDPGLVDGWSRGGACEGACGWRATAAFVVAFGGVKLAKNSSSQLKKVCLSSGERFDQSISGSAWRGVAGGLLEFTGRDWKSGRLDRTMGGGGPFAIGGGFVD